MSARRTRAKRIKYSDNYVPDHDEASISSYNDPDDSDAIRKSRIRDSNKEFARRMTILQTWSEHWSDYTKREGEAYTQQEAKAIIKRAKKISCPITSCRKAFTSIGGLRYHYARCNIEPSFKCLVCNPELTVTTRGELLRHMILNHYQELPSLNIDQQEIANSYFSCQNRLDKSKREKRPNAESETLCNSQRLVEIFRDLIASANSAEALATCSHKDWSSTMKDWELVTHVIERRRFYPPEIESVGLKFPTSGDKVNLRTGESKILDFDKHDSPTSFVFYTGGINTAIAWLPKSPLDPDRDISPELMAVAVNCCSMDQSYSFKESHHIEGCIQLWSFEDGHIKYGSVLDRDKVTIPEVSLKYMICHTYGTIFDMAWCPLGCSWQSKRATSSNNERVGLLALACGDGQVRILSVPYTDALLSRVLGRSAESILESTPMFRVKPVANLMPPGVGPSVDYQQASCKSISWCLDKGQRYIAAGYVSGAIALYDLSNLSPILYISIDNRHIFQPLKTWFAHGGPVTSVAMSSVMSEKALIASGSIDRQLKIFDPMDLNSCIVTDRSPINKISWDFRFRGVISATDTAFTSFKNKVTYKYPVVDGSHSTTISSHRASVYGLASSIVTSSIVTSDQAGEVFVLPQLMSRHSHRRDRNLLSVHSLFTMIPYSLRSKDPNQLVESNQDNHVITISVKKGTTQTSEQENVNGLKSSLNEDLDEDGLDANADFTHVERTIANMPDKFLLPIEHRPVASYNYFKRNFGLEFVHYSSKLVRPESKIPESCLRAMDSKQIYCDRPCDYPFSSINQVTWSPNVSTFSYLLSASQVGICRLDRVLFVEQVYKSHLSARQTDNKD